MTATLPSETSRECHLYRWMVWDRDTGYTTTRLGYIGESEREFFARMAEHVKDKPWSDIYAGHEIDPRVFPDKASVRAAELAAIRAERPLFNERGNEGNPDRIDYEEQVRQRHERDRANGRPLWQPGSAASRRRIPSASRRPPAPARQVRTWRPPRWVRRSWPWAALWLALAVLVGWRLPAGLGAVGLLWVSSGAATFGVGLVVPRRRRRR